MTEAASEALEGVRVLVREPHELTSAERAAIAAIFDEAYAQANQAYLDASIERIGRIAFAVSEDGAPAAYAIGRPRWMDLPGFDASQLVSLHGMRATASELGERDGVRELGCGRYGHASRQGAMVEGNHVPWPGRVLTAWQQAVGLSVAEAYGSNLDPTTFVCRGSGTPIGAPNVKFEASELERAVFAPVQRDRGDNLLAISWSPGPPEGWADPHRPVTW